MNISKKHMKQEYYKMLFIMLGYSVHAKDMHTIVMNDYDVDEIIINYARKGVFDTYCNCINFEKEIEDFKKSLQIRG